MKAKKAQPLNESLEALASQHGLSNLEWIDTWIDDENPELQAIAERCSSQTHLLTPLGKIPFGTWGAALYKMEDGKHFIILFGMPDSFFILGKEWENIL